MWPFALIVGLLVAAVLGLMLPPLLRRDAPVDPDPDDELNRSIYRDRLAELETDRAAGELTEAEYREARDELERDVLIDVRDRAAPAAASGPRPITAVAIGLGLPAIAALAYLSLGTWHALAPAAVDGSDQASAGSLEEMTAGLAARLRSDPDDGEGWLLLARSYATLDRSEEAVEAFSRALSILGDHPDLLVDYAEALATIAGNRLTGEPSRFLDRALDLQPAHQKGLWLAGFAALQAARPSVATERWQTLLALQDPQSEQARVITQLIARTGEEAPAGAGQARLDIRVELAAELAATLDGSETVFVYARAVDGPPMPLAAVRRAASELPLAVTLDETTRMAGPLTLASAKQVLIGARVSRSGSVAPASGDLQGLTGPIEVGTPTPVTVVIDRVLP